MKAVVYEGPHKVSVKEVPDPKAEDPRDVVVRITSTAICGSDLHMYEGHTAMEPGKVLGHEPMGVVEEVGSDVKLIKKGDRVVMPFNIACGVCLNCVHNYYSACLTANPHGIGAGYGYAGLGPHHGGQAELLKVPFADFNCLKLPGTPGDEWEDEFILLADILGTGYQANLQAKVKPGATVAVFGAGPVGLMSAYCAIELFGASEVYVVDMSEARLKLAKQIGGIPINFTQGDPVKQIQTLRRENQLRKASLRPGEEKMTGVQCGIDAVGYQAFDRTAPTREKPEQVLEDLIHLVNPTGHIGVIGVYMPQDPQGPTPEAKHGVLPLSFGQLWHKGLTVETGQAIIKQHQYELRDLIMAGKLKPSFVVSHRLPLEEAAEGYRQFDKRNGYTKVILKAGKH